MPTLARTCGDPLHRIPFFPLSTNTLLIDGELFRLLKHGKFNQIYSMRINMKILTVTVENSRVCDYKSTICR